MFIYITPNNYHFLKLKTVPLKKKHSSIIFKQIKQWKIHLVVNNKTGVGVAHNFFFFFYGWLIPNTKKIIYLTR